MTISTYYLNDADLSAADGMNHRGIFLDLMCILITNTHALSGEHRVATCTPR